MLFEKQLDKEYLGITGLPEFTAASGALAFGKDSPVVTEGRVFIRVCVCACGALCDYC